MSELILASNSPRRRELLHLGGWSFQSRPGEVDESRLPGEAPADYVLRLAESKARVSARTAGGEELILAADTAVVDGNASLGKPRDAEEALQMLRGLRGHTHQVLTGLALLQLPEGNILTDLCVTNVPMRDYGEDEMAAYIASGDPLDKAGAYGIQNRPFHPVEALQGCYASVMGLPLCHLTRSLRKLARADVQRADTQRADTQVRPYEDDGAEGADLQRADTQRADTQVRPYEDIAAKCRAAFDYDCPISSAVLRGEMAG